LLLGEGIEFVDQSFRMHPTQSMVSDVELAGVIADDDHVAEKLVRVDTAPQRALGGDLHRVGGHGQRGDAEPFKMRLPGRRIGKLLLGMLRQPGNGGSGEGMFVHVGQSRLVDHVISVSGPQQIEEVKAALAARGAEPGEIIIADLRADAVDALMPRAGVIHRDPGGGLQPRAQHVT
jgi:hypothetical protein